MSTQKEKCEQFSRLHQEPGAFVMPNPWDAGSAKLLQGMGFKALATTSAGLAYTLGRVDGEVSLQEKLQHCSQLTAATTIPINADFENGFAHVPDKVAANVVAVINTGVAGCSIEDYNPERDTIYDFNLSVERIQAAAEVVRAVELPFMLTARAENLLRDVDDLDDTILRLQAYQAAGAQVLYAPGIASLEQLKRVTDELDHPFNILAPFIPDASVNDFAKAGAKRISVGGALNWAAVNPVLEASTEMLQQGTFSWTSNTARSGAVNKLLREPGD